jgi:hypothetical protein
MNYKERSELWMADTEIGSKIAAIHFKLLDMVNTQKHNIIRLLSGESVNAYLCHKESDFHRGRLDATLHLSNQIHNLLVDENEFINRQIEEVLITIDEILKLIY